MQTSWLQYEAAIESLLNQMQGLKVRIRIQWMPNDMCLQQRSAHWAKQIQDNVVLRVEGLFKS